VTGLATLGAVVEGARCWGIELDPRYRVLAVTIEPDPLRTPGTAREHHLRTRTAHGRLGTLRRGASGHRTVRSARTATRRLGAAVQPRGTHQRWGRQPSHIHPRSQHRGRLPLTRLRTVRPCGAARRRAQAGPRHAWEARRRRHPRLTCDRLRRPRRAGWGTRRPWCGY